MGWSTAMVEARREGSRWRRIALPVSVVLNLFLVALIVGHVVHNRAGFGAMGETPLARALANAEAILPSKDAAAFGAVIRRDAPRYADAQKQLDAARQEVRRQIATPEFDATRVHAALAAWRAAWNRFSDDFGDTLVDALAQVSPAGRQKLVAERRAAH
jgi:uncharacterized membrane protein